MPTRQYDKQLLADLSDQHRQGRRIVLATGSDKQVAERITQHLELFGLVLATEGDNNFI